MLEASTKTEESHGFQNMNLCVCLCAGYVSDEYMQPLELVIEEDEGFPHEGINEKKNQKKFIREEETTLPHKSSQREYYTQ